MAELLNGNLDLVGLAVPDDLDLDPPAAVLAALAGRTGVDLARIRAMTLAGWRPWLLDTLDAEDKQATFDNYVRVHSVLLTPRRGVGNGLAGTDSGAGRGCRGTGTTGRARSAQPCPAGAGRCSAGCR